MFTKVLLLAVFAIVVVSAHYVHHEIHHPQPYKFGYTIKDKHGQQHREEVGDGHSGVKGSYSFTDDKGIHRRVDYVADKGGFRAHVKTNEPGTANQNPAAVQMDSSADGGYGYGGAAYGGAGYGIGGVGAGGFGYGAVPAVGYGMGGYGLGDGLISRYDSRYGVY